MPARDKSFTMEMTVGLFVLAMLLMLAIFSIFISKKAFFREVYRWDVYFESVSGLRDGDSVYYRGLLLGKIDNMTIDNEVGGVDVTLSLEQPITLYEDYKVEIVTSSALGGKQLNIRQGTPGRPRIPSGTRLNGDPPMDLIEEAVGTIDFIRTELEEGGLISNLSIAASNLVSITEKIDEGEGAISQLINQTDLYDEAREAVSNLRTVSSNLVTVSENVAAGKGTIGKLLSDDESLYKDIETIAENLRETSERINSMVAGIEAGKGSLGKLLSEDDALYENLLATSESIRSFSDKLQSGDGTLSKLIDDDTLYVEVLELVREGRAALDDLRETSPITTFGSLFFGAF